MRSGVFFVTLTALGAACSSFGSDRSPDTVPATDAAVDSVLAADAPNPEGGGPSYADIVMADGPLAYFRLDEASGNVTDRVAKTIATTTNVTYGVAGAIASDPDTALGFDGITSSINLGGQFDRAGNLPFSIEAWVEPSLPDTKDHFVVSREGIDKSSLRQGYSLFVSSEHKIGVERFVDGQNNAGVVRGASALDDTRYTHVVGTYDGAVVALYVDGAFVASLPDARPLTVTPGVLAAIGSASDGTFGFDGRIDEVAIYDKALLPDRVAAHYHAGVGR